MIQGHIRVVELLLESGRYSDLRNSESKTASDLACLSHEDEDVKTLLEYGRDILLSEPGPGLVTERQC